VMVGWRRGVAAAARIAQRESSEDGGATLRSKPLRGVATASVVSGAGKSSESRGGNFRSKPLRGVATASVVSGSGKSSGRATLRSTTAERGVVASEIATVGE